MTAVVRLGDSGMQNAVCNVYERNHALKFQAIVTPDGMFFHIFVTLERQGNDWTLHSRSIVDERLASMLKYGGMQYCINSERVQQWFVF